MLDSINELADHVMGSPWVYLVILAVAATDAFFPAVPSETVVIAAGVFAAADGTPNLPLVMAFAALGALVGDHVSYFVGRGAGGRLMRRAGPGTRRRAAFDWAGRALAARGGVVLLVARYVPGGRTAVTLTMGAVGYPQRTFTLFDALAATSWGAYCALVGYVGGAAFEDSPLKGLLLGLGLALSVSALVELARHGRVRARARRAGRGSRVGADR